MKPFSVVLPAYNEERGIGGVLDRLRQLFPGVEVIVVDDGSADRTAEVAKGRHATVIRHPANLGYGQSLKDGIAAATHELIVIADADGSYPVDRIPELLKLLEQGFAMAVGARQGSHYRGSLLKMPARIAFKLLVEFTTGRHIPDINSGLRAFRKSQVVPLFADLCSGFSFTTTITLIYLLTAKPVVYIPIDYHKRVGRSKVRFLRDSLRTLQYITEVIVTYNPLKLFLLLSMLPLLLGAALVGLAYRTGADTAALSVILLLASTGSLIVFGMGLQMHVLRR